MPCLGGRLSLAEPTSGDRAVGFLDHSDLRCGCGRALESAVLIYGFPVKQVKGFRCAPCEFFVTEMEFLQNHHGTREARRARILNRVIGRTLQEINRQVGAYDAAA